MTGEGSTIVTQGHRSGVHNPLHFTMITSRRFLPILALASSISSGKAAATLDRPKFEATARVKSHFHKNGQLVKGEEDLLKIIVKWDHVPGAKSYECEWIDVSILRTYFAIIDLV